MVHIVEWLKSELLLLVIKKQEAQFSGMALVLLQTKCWDVDFWHIVKIGELLIL